MKKTIPNLILEDLTAGRSTAASIADRLEMDPSHIATICRNLERDSLLEAIPLGPLTVYRLTLAGREKIAPSPALQS